MKIVLTVDLRPGRKDSWTRARIEQLMNMLARLLAEETEVQSATVQLLD